MTRRSPSSTLFPYTTLFRSLQIELLLLYFFLTSFVGFLADAFEPSGNPPADAGAAWSLRSEEHTSELQSLRHLVCRLLLEKKKTNNGASAAAQELYSCTHLQ